MKKRIAAVICAAALVVPLISINAEYSDSDIKKTITDAVNWKNEYDNPFYSIGTNNSNLYITALSRLGESYDYASYLYGLDGVAAGYDEKHNAADMQRTALAVMASGGDAQNVGGRDLVADSTFYRDATAPLGKNGLNDYSWALIALDAGNFETPDWSLMNRNQIIAALLAGQDTDGSFGGDVYTTAAAVTALAPYINTSGAYTITQSQTGWTFDLSPYDAVNNALAYLSEMQMKDGDWGNLDATAMVNIALDSVGIDSEKDANFSARNGSAFDGLMSYKNNDGGFSYEEKKSDGEATSYALCALVSHLAKKQGKSGVFRVKAEDKVTLTSPTAAPAATAAPKSNTNTSSGSTSNSNTNTVRTVTPRPASTPRATNAPSNTMRPTRTAAPLPSTSPSASTRPVTTPRPTKRPALVGPVEMPGPMPSASPDTLMGNTQNNGNAEHSGAGVIAAVTAGVLLLLAAAAAALLIIRNKNKAASKKPVRKQAVNSYSHSNPADNEYHAKPHRKTEEHMKFERRERYKERLKYRRK